MINKDKYFEIIRQAEAKNATLVAVSKTRSVDAIRELYEVGQKDFGENYVQELVGKQQQLPEDIRWHFIGHLQTNKVKYIAPFVHLIHGVDSARLLKEINKQGGNNKRQIDVLLQVFIAGEETKFGMDEKELEETLNLAKQPSMKNVHVKGLMGMASLSEDKTRIRKEFSRLKSIFDTNPELSVLSMGMSNDYDIALEEGSTIIRIGSLIFGQRS